MKGKAVKRNWSNQGIDGVVPALHSNGVVGIVKGVGLQSIAVDTHTTTCSIDLCRPVVKVPVYMNSAF